MNFTTYQAEEFYMVRVPLLPFDEYLNLFSSEPDTYEENLVFFLKSHPEVREAITVASSSLGAELNDLENLLGSKTNKKKRVQVVSAITKYLIRMSTRTTPYGLFSGVTMGSFDDKTKLSISQKPIKRTRPDMEWIYKVIRSFESDQKFFWHLKFKANPLAYVNGNRLEMGYISNYGQASDLENGCSVTASIRYTKPVEIVMKEAQQFVSLSELKQNIVAMNPQVPEEKINMFFIDLIKNEYLLSELRPPLINNQPLQYIITILSKLQNGGDFYKSLNAVQTMIEKYDATNIGDGIGLYQDIINKMKGMFEASNYLQVDMAISRNEMKIEREVKSCLNELIDVLAKLSSVQSRSYLDDYIEEFLEFYGEYREVAILELLDEDKGLGAPATYTRPQSRKSFKFSGLTEEETVVQNYFSVKITEALKLGSREIVIDDREVEALSLKNIDPSEWVPSLELYAFIHSEEEHYQVYLSPTYGSSAAGKTFGRFMDIMPKETQSHLEAVHDAEKILVGDDQIIAEVVELPQSGRVTNVTLNWSPKKYEINLASTACCDKTQLDIQDLYIGVHRLNDKNKFYIKSRSLNKEVYVKANNMANSLKFSNLYRFLCEISDSEKMKPLSVLHKIEEQYCSHFEYMPKIKYKNIVLKPERWSLSEKALGLNLRTMDGDQFFEAFDAWRAKWAVCETIYIKDYDNRLMLNVSNAIHRDELLNAFKKSKGSLILTSVEEPLSGLIMKGSTGNYFSEIVVPFRKRFAKPEVDAFQFHHDVLVTKSPYGNNQSMAKTWASDRTFIIGDEWLYFKLYGVEKRIDEFIGFELSNFFDALLANNLSERFFYIRYADPMPHIRLRIKVAIEKQGDMIQFMNQWLKQLRASGLVTIVQMDTYIRETERYGGDELIKLAEDIFHYDSIATSAFLKMKRSGQSTDSFDCFVCASVLDVLENFGIPYDAQLELFSKLIDQKLNREMFQKKRKKYMEICNSNGEWHNLRQETFGEIWHQLFKKRRESLRTFSKRMTQLDEEGVLTNSKVGIVLSLIHMHFNRLYGSTVKEKEMMSMIRHTLQSLAYLKTSK